MEQDTARNTQDILWLKDGMKDIQTTLKEMGNDISDGFIKTHQKQDITNGRIGKAETKLGRAEVKINIIWAVLGVLGTAIVGMVFTIITRILEVNI